MNHESASEEMKSLWQNQPTEPPKICPEDFRPRLDKFERKIFWRNAREYAAGVVVIAGFGYFGWKLSGLLVRVGAGLIIAGTLVVMYELHRRGSVRTAPADLGLSTCIDFHRKSLERQRDALRTVGTWYLLPFVPGLVVFEIGSAMSQWAAHAVGLGQLVTRFLISGGMIAGVFFGVWLLNQWAARKLQKRIDELTAMGRGQD
ncbi:MAG TPA: hypothetical protein VG267_13010 [Terracidiphilus sp.]|jgi:hypothetical protein|nr:hypothetical protein [Terracidiphilus sp.]